MIDIANYSAIFLFISPLFLENQFKSKIALDVIKKIQNYATLQNRLIGLIFPPSTTQNSQFLKAKQLIKNVNLLDRKTKIKFKEVINALLLFNIYKNKFYDTALFPKKEKTADTKDEEISPLELKDNESKIIAAILPIKYEFKTLKKTAFPFGLYLKNNNTQNHIFIGKMSPLILNEISEDYRLNPIDKNIGQELQSALEQTLKELFCFLNNDSNNSIEKENVVQEKNVSSSTLRNNQISKKYDWTKNGIYCGWLDLDAYDDAHIDKGIDNIINANLNMLWIRFNPEFYLSKNATLADKKTEYLEQINKFTKKLKEKFEKVNKPLPKIFIGFEISGNFAKKPVNDAMRDIYDTYYSKVPAPFDFANFWKTELLDVFDQFCDEWKTVGNGLNIDGVFLDFEMYHAGDQETSFPQLSDFSETSWKIYETKTDQKIQLQKTKNRINYLYKNNRINEYFDVLKNEAVELGKIIKNHIQAKLPNSIIAAYMPTLPDSWFYKGILSGLSCQEEPVIFATFNNDFNKHNDWLVKNNIFLMHLPVILLSKFRTKEDFALIDQLKKEHAGVWFNRFSRLGYGYEKEKWWTVESSPLDHDLVVKEIGKKIN